MIEGQHPRRVPPAPVSPDDRERAGGRRALRGKRVLVVEDEMLPALEMELAIEDEGGMPLGPIQTVGEGLAFLADGGPAGGIDVAILDVSLHGAEVHPIATLLRERGVPFLFHTGHAARAELQALFPGAPVCPKPISTGDLLDVAGRLIEEG